MCFKNKAKNANRKQMLHLKWQHGFMYLLHFVSLCLQGSEWRTACFSSACFPLPLFGCLHISKKEKLHWLILHPRTSSRCFPHAPVQFVSVKFSGARKICAFFIAQHTIKSVAMMRGVKCLNINKDINILLKIVFTHIDRSTDRQILCMCSTFTSYASLIRSLMSTFCIDLSLAVADACCTVAGRGLSLFVTLSKNLKGKSEQGHSLRFYEFLMQFCHLSPFNVCLLSKLVTSGIIM